MAAPCAFCGTETQLYDQGVPICLRCVEAREKGQKPPKREPSGESQDQTA